MTIIIIYELYEQNLHSTLDNFIVIFIDDILISCTHEEYEKHVLGLFFKF